MLLTSVMVEQLGHVSDIPDNEAKGYETSIGAILIANKDGQYYAYKNVCPHLGINLELLDDEFMDIEKNFILCANHGALFEVETGICVFGPCSGESLEQVHIEIAETGDIFLPTNPQD